MAATEPNEPQERVSELSIMLFGVNNLYIAVMIDKKCCLYTSKRLLPVL